jgi:predicted extracellular nuclease
MRIKKLLALFFVLFVTINANSQSKKYNIHTVAFYNLENLFDTIKGTNNDEEWLPNGAMNWTGKKYKQKLKNLARVLSEVGTSENPNNAPTLIGCCEIENRGVLQDLVNEPLLKKHDYGIVHFDSPDKRGIDVGFLYQKKHFKPTGFKNIPLIIYKTQSGKTDKKEKEVETDDVAEVSQSNSRVYTRDQLLVTGFLDGEEVSVIVNHWPSRSGGEKKSSPFREAAGRLNRKIMDSIFAINPNAKIITMGDLNDGSYNKSVKEGIGAKRKKEELTGSTDIYNPFEEMFHKGNASLFWRDTGDIFDQIMVSEALTRKDYGSFEYWKAGIYNKPYMIQTTGQYKGYPLRNSSVEPGYSDHFPVFIYLIKEIK